jgi:hypothetical protein
MSLRLEPGEVLSIAIRLSLPPPVLTIVTDKLLAYNAAKHVTAALPFQLTVIQLSPFIATGHRQS